MFYYYVLLFLSLLLLVDLCLRLLSYLFPLSLSISRATFFAYISEMQCVLFVDVLPGIPHAFLLHGVGADGAETQCPGMAGLFLHLIHSCRQDQGGESELECSVLTFTHSHLQEQVD